MKVYSYTDILMVTKYGIEFKDGFKISFQECRKEWSELKKIDYEETYCVAERESLSNYPYFVFYSKSKIKVKFDKKGFLSRKRNKDDFQSMQILLNRFGFSSYDLT